VASRREARTGPISRNFMSIAQNVAYRRRRATCTFNCFALDPRSGALFRSTPLPVRLPAAREASPPRRTLARPSRLRFPQLTRSLLEPTCRWAGTSLPCAAQGLVDAVSVCLAWHATPLRDASGTALLVRASCVLVVTPAGGLSDGWFMRTGSASSGTGPPPATLHRPGRRPAACPHSPGHEEAPGREPPRHRFDTRYAPPPRWPERHEASAGAALARTGQTSRMTHRETYRWTPQGDEMPDVRVHGPRDELRHLTRVRPPAGKVRQHLRSGIRPGETNGVTSRGPSRCHACRARGGRDGGRAGHRDRAGVKLMQGEGREATRTGRVGRARGARGVRRRRGAPGVPRRCRGG
jgi:hypothetical protein